MTPSTAIDRKPAIYRLKGVRYSLYLADCLAWMNQQSANSIHAIVTDPPYGLKEYNPEEKQKLRRGKGGIWRIPPRV
jgi:DNA modification methylase